MFPILFEITLPLFLKSYSLIEFFITVFCFGLWYFLKRKEIKLQQMFFPVLFFSVVRYLILTEAPPTVKLHTYGLMMALAFISSITLMTKLAQKQDPDNKLELVRHIPDLVLWIIISSMIGARTLFIIVNWQDYIREPYNIIKIWQGGLVYYGGMIGGLIGTLYYCKKNKINFFLYADILVPFLALGQAIGRVGCFAAGCCWGAVTDSIFGIHFPKDSMPYISHLNDGLLNVAQEHSLAVHPTQLYSVFFNLINFVLLLIIFHRKKFHGQVLLSYLFIYSLIRTTIEFFRGDVERGAVFKSADGSVLLSTSQFISLIVAISAISLIFYLRKQKDHEPVNKKKPKLMKYSS